MAATGFTAPFEGAAPAQLYGLADAIESHARFRPTMPALFDDQGAVTWAEFHERVLGMATGLHHKGVSRGDVVAAADTMSIDYVTLYYATARIGAVLVPLNTNLPHGTVQTFISRTDPKVIVAGASFHDLVADPDRRNSRDVVASSTMQSWGDRITVLPETSLPNVTKPDDPHLIIFTSGTTGIPKAAVLSHRGTSFDSMAGALAAGLRPHDRLFCYQAPYHTGTWAMVRQYMLLGASIVMTRAFDAERAVELLERHSCTSMFAVPLMLQSLVRCKAFSQADLSAFRHLVFASFDPSAVVAPVAQSLRDRGAHNLTLEHIYGMTENSAFIATARSEVCEDDLSSVGTPAPGVNVSIRVDEEEVPPGTIGEICVRSQGLMLGYLNDPAATEDALRGGWLHTGDLGRINESGMLHIVGRLKEMIRTGGVNVYPREVAALLGEHPDVVDCAVFGVPDTDYDERVVAAVVTRNPELTQQDVTTWLRERLAGYQTPRQILFVPELPKTGVGKTAMADLVAMARRASSEPLLDATSASPDIRG